MDHAQLGSAGRTEPRWTQQHLQSCLRCPRPCRGAAPTLPHSPRPPAASAEARSRSRSPPPPPHKTHPPQRPRPPFRPGREQRLRLLSPAAHPEHGPRRDTSPRPPAGCPRRRPPRCRARPPALTPSPPGGARPRGAPCLSLRPAAAARLSPRLGQCCHGNAARRRLTAAAPAPPAAAPASPSAPPQPGTTPGTGRRCRRVLRSTLLRGCGELSETGRRRCGGP